MVLDMQERISLLTAALVVVGYSVSRVGWRVSLGPRISPLKRISPST